MTTKDVKHITYSMLTTLSILAGLFGVWTAAAEPPAPPLPRCQEEDGSDIDGVCVWIDPDTGNSYINPTPEEVLRNERAAESTS